MGLTITEKILARVCGRKVAPGEIVYVVPDVIVSHEFSFLGNSLPKTLESLGVTKVNFDPDRIILGIDHRIPAHNPSFAEGHKNMRKFAKEQGIKHFYDVGRAGVNHQADAERGHALPGMLYGSGDPMCSTLGALGCLAVSAPVLEVLATGEFWMRVPSNLKFEIAGRLGKGVMSRDLIQKILGDIGAGGSVNRVMEFVGPGVEAMSIDYRMILCNQTKNAGAVSGIVNPDKKVIDWVTPRAKWPFNAVTSDSDAEYEETYNYNLDELEPLVAAPHDPRNTKTVAEVEGVEVDQGVIGTCAGGRPDELRVVAQILKNRKVSPSTRLIIVPPTLETYMIALKEGMIDTFMKAEAVVCNPNCGPCAGGHMGVIASGEVCVGTNTLNIPGRMGSPEAAIYLASPATVAASAVAGKLTDPRKYL